MVVASHRPAGAVIACMSTPRTAPREPRASPPTAAATEPLSASKACALASVRVSACERVLSL